MPQSSAARIISTLTAASRVPFASCSAAVFWSPGTPSMKRPGHRKRTMRAPLHAAHGGARWITMNTRERTCFRNQRNAARAAWRDTRRALAQVQLGRAGGSLVRGRSTGLGGWRVRASSSLTLVVLSGRSFGRPCICLLRCSSTQGKVSTITGRLADQDQTGQELSRSNHEQIEPPASQGRAGDKRLI